VAATVVTNREVVAVATSNNPLDIRTRTIVVTTTLEVAAMIIPKVAATVILEAAREIVVVDMVGTTVGAIVAVTVAEIRAATTKAEIKAETKVETETMEETRGATTADRLSSLAGAAVATPETTTEVQSALMSEMHEMLVVILEGILAHGLVATVVQLAGGAVMIVADDDAR